MSVPIGRYLPWAPPHFSVHGNSNALPSSGIMMALPLQSSPPTRPLNDGRAEPRPGSAIDIARVIASLCVWPRLAAVAGADETLDQPKPLREQRIVAELVPGTGSSRRHPPLGLEARAPPRLPAREARSV
jgi:hypothetical protein